jgi:hypothetical protein
MRSVTRLEVSICRWPPPPPLVTSDSGEHALGPLATAMPQLRHLTLSGILAGMRLGGLPALRRLDLHAAYLMECDRSASQCLSVTAVPATVAHLEVSRAFSVEPFCGPAWRLLLARQRFSALRLWNW